MANLNLKHNIVRIPEGDIDAAFERELRTGFKMEKAMQEDRLKSAHKTAASYDKRKTAGCGLGKMIAEIPALDYFRIKENYPGCWEDKKFIHDYQRLVPDSKVASI